MIGYISNELADLSQSALLQHNTTMLGSPNALA